MGSHNGPGASPAQAFPVSTPPLHRRRPTVTFVEEARKLLGEIRDALDALAPECSGRAARAGRDGKLASSFRKLRAPAHVPAKARARKGRPARAGKRLARQAMALAVSFPAAIPAR
jgi:hypothetical protein